MQPLGSHIPPSPPPSVELSVIYCIIEDVCRLEVNCCCFPISDRIIQQLVNGIIAPATIPNLGVGPW